MSKNVFFQLLNSTRRKESIFKKYHPLLVKHIVGKKVLDIGFAQKPNIYIKGKILYGVDIQKVEKPSNYFEVKNVNLNDSPLPYRNNFFDTVMMSDVIEHLENPSRVLRESNRVLRDGGRLIVSTPQANYFYDFVKNLIYSFFRLSLDRDIGSHLSNWTILDFRRLLRKNSFELEKILGGYLYLPFYISIPVHPFPILGWQVIYVCKKNGQSDKLVYTNNNKGVLLKLR